MKATSRYVLPAWLGHAAPGAGISDFYDAGATSSAAQS